MMKILHNAARVVTVNTAGKNYKRGKDMGSIGLLENHSVIVEDNLISDIVPSSSVKNLSVYKVYDLTGKVLLPGLVECHTHTAFAGSRANEFREKIAGKTYEEIALAGGGINATVNAVRASSFDELVRIIKPRIEYFISQGITTLEIKSGYGLDTPNELKLLEVIKYLDSIYPIDIVPTFLGAHTFPAAYKNNREAYIEEIINKMLPAVAEKKLAVFCDAFCEAAAFTAEETGRIFSAAARNGLKIKLHTEQFNNIGGLDTAIKHNAVSADHLEMIKKEDIRKIASSGTTAVLLPGVSFFLNYNYAPARELIENNAVVAIATDYNPGSSFISNLNLVMSFAAVNMKMKIEETISAVTINAAKALDLHTDRGSIELNKKADFAVFNTADYSDIVYNVGKNLNCMTFKNGELIYST
jgi:imidazolonepropionase